MKFHSRFFSSFAWMNSGRIPLRRGECKTKKKEEVMNMNFNLDQVPYLAEVDRLLMRD